MNEAHSPHPGRAKTRIPAGCRGIRSKAPGAATGRHRPRPLRRRRTGRAMPGRLWRAWRCLGIWAAACVPAWPGRMARARRDEPRGQAPWATPWPADRRWRGRVAGGRHDRGFIGDAIGSSGTPAAGGFTPAQAPARPGSGFGSGPGSGFGSAQAAAPAHSQAAAPEASRPEGSASLPLAGLPLLARKAPTLGPRTPLPSPPASIPGWSTSTSRSTTVRPKAPAPAWYSAPTAWCLPTIT